ncbi:hypothetical protein SynRS9915_01018 [Synechococcus sp. RS9915]|nr:hypothetical protein SynRS9915_01018 [Synechococcus sp. RS9915]
MQPHPLLIGLTDNSNPDVKQHKIAALLKTGRFILIAI